jgi:RNA 3'-terminal phosphate cyclase (GTP)
MSMLCIDGSYKEGGGQILRTALALSTLTGLPFRAEKIRQRRPVPGLKPQHLQAIQALMRMSGVRAEGARAGSATVEFYPGSLEPGDYEIDIATAGSITLMLQALLVPCLFAPGTITLRIRGGSDVRWSMPLDYLRHVILPVFRHLADLDVCVLRRGFYPKGQGRLELSIRPKLSSSRFRRPGDFLAALRSRFPGVDLGTRPVSAAVHGISAASSNLAKARVAERQAQAVRAELPAGIPLEIREEYGPSASPGTVVTLWATDSTGRAFAGGDALGEKGKPAEAVGREAAEKLLHVLNSAAAVDVHLADNLIPLLALRGGRIRTERITDHIRSGIYVCEKFLDVRFEVDEGEGLICVEEGRSAGMGAGKMHGRAESMGHRVK